MPEGVEFPFPSLLFYEGRTYGQPEVVRISLPQVATGLRLRLPGSFRRRGFQPDLLMPQEALFARGAHSMQAVMHRALLRRGCSGRYHFLLGKTLPAGNQSRMQYGELYHRNYYKEVHVKNRVYYEYYHLDGTQEVPTDYKEISFVCLRPDGSLELPSTLSIVCRSVAKKLEGFEDFHFHQLRHTYTSNLLSNGAAPKDVQELLGHSDVSTTMNIYAHSTRKAKRDSARLLDKVVSNA
jgi:hypothetical protein